MLQYAHITDPRHSGRDESTSSSWGTPDLSLLGNGRRAAPAFPTDLLGPFWSQWCKRAAQNGSAPIDYVAVSLLACVGAALANVRWPVAGADWSEPPVLWCGLVGSPSSGKSPAMDAAFALVRHSEDKMALGFDEDRRSFETTRTIAEAKREAWKGDVKAAVKAGNAPPAMPSDAEEPDAPVRPRIRVADVTMEKLAALAASLPRGLLVVRDELSGWLGSFDKYGGGGADRAFFIEAYGGRSYTVDRVKNPEPVRIRHLSIGVLGGVQPDKLPILLEGPDDGLVPRLLWSWPDSLPTFHLSRVLSDDATAKLAYARLTDLAIGSDEFGCPEPKRLRLTSDAENVIEGFAQDIARRAHDAHGVFAGALGKARGHVLRLAAILEHLWWCAAPGGNEPSEITQEAVAAAAGLVDGYFIPMAERVFGDASIPVAERAAMGLARHLRKIGRTEFNARETRRQVGGAVRNAPAMEAACAVLEEAGLIRPMASSATGPGRKAKDYAVHPALLEGARSAA